MICITGGEKNLETLSARISRFSHAFLQEIRLDYQVNPSRALDDLLKNNPPEVTSRWIVTCRPVRQRGSFKGSEKERITLIKKAIRNNVGFIDIEWRADRTHEEALFSEKQPGQQIVLSHHVFADDWKTEDIIRILEDMICSSADILKIALMVDDVARFTELKSLAERFNKKPLVLVPMGEAGVIGRVFYHFFKSPWTYVAAGTCRENQTTAPGQVFSSDMESLGLHPNDKEQSKQSLIVLFGGTQVMHSPGPPTYNNFFRSKGLPFVYLPAPTKNLEKAVAALSPMGLVGAAVTMPHKDGAAHLCTKLHGPAQQLHSINTMVLRGETWEGYSTDGYGVSCAISQHLQNLSKDRREKARADSRIRSQDRGRRGARPARREEGERLAVQNPVRCIFTAASMDRRPNPEVIFGSALSVSVLGAGGAARAAALAMKDNGAEVTLFARRPEKTRCDQLGLNVDKWELRQKKAWDVLINATPIGSRSGEECVSPISFSGSENLSNKVVLDMNYRPRCTALLKAAAERGAQSVTGLEMWIHQGIPQLELWTGSHVDAKDLRPLIPPMNEKQGK